MGLFGKRRKAKARSHGTTIIAEGTRFTGELNLDGKLHIDGAMEGTIICRGDLSIGRSGYFEGTVEAEHLVVSGHVQGHVRCQSLEIVHTGQVCGEVSAQHFVIEPGGQFVGESNVCGALPDAALSPEPQALPAPAEDDEDSEALPSKVARIR